MSVPSCLYHLVVDAAIATTGIATADLLFVAAVLVLMIVAVWRCFEVVVMQW